MEKNDENNIIQKMKEEYPKKFLAEDKIFSNIHPGDRIFIGSGCGEPVHLVNTLINYVEKQPKAFFDAEVLQIWTLDVAPYTNEKFKSNFRYNSFFIGNKTRYAVNNGIADYTPVFLSQVPDLFYRKLVTVDIALIQVSMPNEKGDMSLGVSVDITRAGLENASIVIAQINDKMPWVNGDTIINIKDLDYVICHNEELLEYKTEIPNEIIQKIGNYVSRIVDDGDTIQVGYGTLPNAILSNLGNKKNLGVHSELLSDGIVNLIKKGVINNKNKTIHQGKTIASFCMGTKDTYEFIHNNPNIELKTISYTNNPLIIAQNSNMTAINTALQIDLTGQASAESIGKLFYSGIGGQADFMRGTLLGSGGKTILTIQSTTENGEISRIVPFVNEGAGVTLTRGDVHYVVSEYGIAYLHGKSIRERAMDLISIAHPKFRPWLIEEAKKNGLIFKDQAFIKGEKGEYPENLETYRTTKTGIKLFLRPVKINDENLLKDFFYSLSDTSIYYRFFSPKKDMPHERLQGFVVIDYTKAMIILAVLQHKGKEEVIGLGQYDINEDSHTADVAFVVRDDYQNQGIGAELVKYINYLANKKGLRGLTAEVLTDNTPMINLFMKEGFEHSNIHEVGVILLKKTFSD